MLRPRSSHGPVACTLDYKAKGQVINTALRYARTAGKFKLGPNQCAISVEPAI